MVDQQLLQQELRKLSFARYRLRFLVQTPLLLPPYKGSTFRGAFGNAFKRLVCIRGDGQCSRCLVRGHCVYQYVFETPAVENARSYSHAPHPFVIEPPEGGREHFAVGETLEVGLVLLGKALAQLPYFIYAFDAMGQRGLGKGRGKLRLETVDAWDGARWKTGYERATGVLEAHLPIFRGAPPEPGEAHMQDMGVQGKGAEAHGPDRETQYQQAAANREETCIQGDDTSARREDARPPEDTMYVRLRTPTRLKRGGHLEGQLPFALLVRGLLRRTADLVQFHCDARLELPFAAWITAAEQVQVRDARLHWQDWERYSSRQKTHMKMGGLLGEIGYGGPWLAFRPLLRLGEELHVGKGTAFGLGKYRIWRGEDIHE